MSIKKAAQSLCDLVDEARGGDMDDAMLEGVVRGREAILVYTFREVDYEIVLTKRKKVKPSDEA